jgi:hypothetical protein
MATLKGKRSKAQVGETPKARKEREDNERINSARDLVIAYQSVFETEMGKKVLFDLMNRFHAVNDFPAIDPNLLLRQVGQRSVICTILNTAGIDVAEFYNMMKGE